jgi:hypothetical protein
VRKDGHRLATRFKEGIFVGEEGGSWLQSSLRWQN